VRVSKILSIDKKIIRKELGVLAQPEIVFAEEPPVGTVDSRGIAKRLHVTLQRGFDMGVIGGIPIEDPVLSDQPSGTLRNVYLVAEFHRLQDLASFDQVGVDFEDRKDLLFIRNLYKPWVPNKSDAHYLVVSRLMVAVTLAGGITTIGCMASPQRGETFMDALAREAGRARAQSMCDIFLHPILSSAAKETLALLAELPNSGHSDIKIFMTGASFADFQPQWTDIVREAGRLGLISMALS
jgi:hypothetical protein